MATTTTTAAKQAAKEDAKNSGPAGIPGVEPAPRTRPVLSEQERKKRAAEQLDSRITNLEYRTTQVCKAIADMGVSSLASYLQRFTDVPLAIREQALREVEARVAKCRAALEASKTAAPTATATMGISLRGALNPPTQ